MGYPIHEGLHWTTDAIYRETFSKVRKYSQMGIASVDMELSALVAVAEYRGIELAALHVVTDMLEEKYSWKGLESQEFIVGRDHVAEIAANVFIS